MPSLQAENRVDIGLFSQQNINNCQKKICSAKTLYSLRLDKPKSDVYSGQVNQLWISI